jgi:hypothetical protein
MNKIPTRIHTKKTKYNFFERTKLEIKLKKGLNIKQNLKTKLETNKYAIYQCTTINNFFH